MKDPLVPGRRKRARGRVHFKRPAIVPVGSYMSACNRVLRDPPNTEDAARVTCPHCLNALGEQVETVLLKKEQVHMASAGMLSPQRPVCGAKGASLTNDWGQVSCPGCQDLERG